MNIFELAAKISLDTSEYEGQLDDASGKTHNFGENLKNGLATAAKVGAAGLAVATTAVTALSKAALDSYGDYEQLTGGVETLFGAGGKSLEEYAESVGGMTDKVKRQYNDLITAQEFVMEDAANAYKTAGLSANEYMETVTSFSAALIQSLGGDTMAAAEYANTAITDMSDNANKMGTAMDSIQNAYQGFAKQNFTMLDNLKLGYGGTKEEMQRLLSDAEKLSGQKFDISSYADIVDAIHVVQTEMGITGTTAAEAATTIQGSVASAKSAWDNLVTGIGNENADLSGLITQFVDSVGTAAENIIPRVQQILVGIGEAVQTIAPVIAEQVPALIEGVLPSLLEAGVSLVNGLLSGIISALPALAEAAPGIIEQLSTAIIDNLPSLITAALTVITTLASGISESLPELIPAAIEAILQIVETLIDNVDQLVDAAIEIILALADGLIEALPKLIEKAPVIIEKLVTAIANNTPKIIKAGMDLLIKFSTGIIKSIPELLKSIPKIIASIVNGFTLEMSNIIDIGENIVKGLWDGITAMGDWIKDKVSGFFGGIVDSVKGLLGIHSPSKVFAGIGENMALGLGDGWNGEYDRIRKQIENGMSFEPAVVDVNASFSKKNNLQANGFSASNYGVSEIPPISLTIPLYLDGNKIGEAAYTYIQNRERAYGGAY